jgi:hypothetical protein
MSEREAEAQEEAAVTAENLLMGVLNINPPISIATMAKKCNWLDRDGEPMKSKAQRVIKRLADEKLVHKLRGHWRLTRKGRAIVAGEEDE